MRANGYQIDVVERWISFGGKGGIRKDFCGYADLIAYNADHIIAIQTTSTSNMSSRLSKSKENEALADWLKCSSRHFVIHGWAKRGGKGKRKTWELKVTPVTKV